MPKFENVRTTADAVGRITCIKTGREIGLLYRWGNGETQTALYDNSPPEKTQMLEQRADLDASYG